VTLIVAGLLDMGFKIIRRCLDLPDTYI
jgi:hypothetical protein